MLCLAKPSDATTRRFLAGQAGLPYTYGMVGATATQPPAGFVVDHTRVALGEGAAVLQAAVAALARWEHFRLRWLDIWPAEDAPQAGQQVAVIGRALGLWWVNACRVVYVVDEVHPVRRYGFAYGTLPGHIECGEERFLVEWDPPTGTVWFDILAFSRPRSVLARLGYPAVRRLQKRFARDAAAALSRAVQQPQLAAAR